MKPVSFTRNMLIQSSLILLAIACYVYGSIYATNKVISAIGVGGIFGFSMSIWFTVAMWCRPIERDDHGNPMVRYCGPRFTMPLCAVVFAVVGFVELNNPINYRYSGNLLILAYIPLAISVFTLFVSIYFWKYRVTMKSDMIEREVWPNKSERYPLRDLVSIEDNRPRNAILKFSDGRQIKLYSLLSGLAYFVDNAKNALSEKRA